MKSIFIELSTTVYGRDIIHNYVLYMIPYCYSNYSVSIGDPTVRLTTLLIGSVFFEGLKMTQKESKNVVHVSVVIDITINCCVRLLHLVPMLLY